MQQQAQQVQQQQSQQQKPLAHAAAGRQQRQRRQQQQQQQSLPAAAAPLTACAFGPWLEGLPNLNAAWCSLLVEELCRQGVTMFCVAPGGGQTYSGVQRAPRDWVSDAIALQADA